MIGAEDFKHSFCNKREGLIERLKDAHSSLLETLMGDAAIVEELLVEVRVMNEFYKQWLNN